MSTQQSLRPRQTPLFYSRAALLPPVTRTGPVAASSAGLPSSKIIYTIYSFCIFIPAIHYQHYTSRESLYHTRSMSSAASRVSLGVRAPVNQNRTNE